MKNTFWFGASGAALLCAYGLSAGADPALAQSVFPPVSVDAPAAPRARPAAVRAAPRSNSARRASNPRASAVEVPVAQPLVSTAASPGQVVGYVATTAGTGTKSDTPIVQVPQTINVITADQIRDQGAQSVSQALGYTRASASAISAPCRPPMPTRGCGFRADQYLDGTRLPIRGDGAASYAIEPYGLERIEDLKGPASGLYGRADRAASSTW